MADNDILAWREAVLEDPEISKFCSLMFHAQEDKAFANLNGFVMEEGRNLASKIHIYAASKGYDFTEEEVLSGFRTAAPEIQEMVKQSWEKALGSYHRAQIAKGKQEA